MDSRKLNDWMQVVGMFAVVASLIFVGLQMKQSQEIALSQAFQMRSDSTIEMLISTAESPEFLAAVAQAGSPEPRPLTPEEEVAMIQYATVMLFLSENLHYQYVNGFVDEERWVGGKNTLRLMLSGQVPLPVRAAFERLPNSWNQAFRDEVQALINEIDAETR